MRCRRVILASLLAVCVTGASSGARADQALPISLKVAMSVVNYDAAPLYYAQRSGIFARAGLNVEIERIARGEGRGRGFA